MARRGNVLQALLSSIGLVALLGLPGCGSVVDRFSGRREEVGASLSGLALARRDPGSAPVAPAA